MEKLSDYDYFLPSELIATAPREDRHSSRLLRLAKGAKAPLHDQFVNIDTYFAPGDVLVVNNTKVMKARISARKSSGGRVHILLVRPLPNGNWSALMNGRGPFLPGVKLSLGAGIDNNFIEVVGKSALEPGLYELSSNTNLFLFAESAGQMPLPPYFGRDARPEDEIGYQTIFAKGENWGAVAAPTAGLHFSDYMLEKLRKKGVHIKELTLHVGPGTFLPIRVENIADHRMHKEWFSLSEDTACALNRAKAQGNRVIAVGTTSLRVLEQVMSWASIQNSNQFYPCDGVTELFIKPGFRFQAADGLLTNFHLPRSTLLVLVSAVLGRERALAAYEEAVKLKYNFFSYGDLCFFDMENL